ncbi:hypothetical protein SynA15127_01475 [Synechococcus sp. A15-127]|nr:hypothetical protein SynA15127_01475 [Synechococcus sp. A15-127]
MLMRPAPLLQALAEAITQIASSITVINSAETKSRVFR